MKECARRISLLLLAALGGCVGSSENDGPPDIQSGLGTASLFSEPFDEFSTGSWKEGSSHGAWIDVDNGDGSTRIEHTSSANKVLDEKPERPSAARDEHDALVRTSASFGDLDLTVQLNTVQQLRTAPNPSEMGRVLWHVSDTTHFYYVLLKTNGWELGKKDASAPAGQVTLAMGATPTFPVGNWHTVRIVQTGAAINASVDGVALASVLDASTPYLTGSVGLYAADAHARFDNVRVSSPSGSTGPDDLGARGAADMGAEDLRATHDLGSAHDLSTRPEPDMTQPSTGLAGRAIPAPIYGVTLDDVSNVSGELTALKALAHVPTARVVFDRQEAASYYATPITKLRAGAYIMGQLLDSSDMSAVTTVAAAQTRAQSYVSTLGTNVDVWEIGNEVNGDWLATNTQDTMGKIEAMYDAVAAAHMATALTFFYEGEPTEAKNCISTDKGGNDMFTWITQQFQLSLPIAQRSAATESLRTGLNYALISWYPDQCPGENPDWTTVYTRLASIFPNARVGFGELGTANPQNGSQYEIDEIDDYYPLATKMTLPANYIGGYFWWYFAEEMVPDTTTLWTTLNTAIQ